MNAPLLNQNDKISASFDAEKARGDFEILSATDYDVFVVAWRKPNGRYGEGLDKVDKLFPKGTLVTMRNWNTILKAVA